MVKDDLDEQSLEKLAWIIAEEFVDNCEKSNWSECSGLGTCKKQDHKLRMVFAWGNPAVALPRF